MSIRSIFIGALFTIIQFSCVFGQNAEEFRPKQLGFTVSSLNGVGFYYLSDLTYEDNLKISALVWDTDDDDAFYEADSDPLKYSLGIEYQRDLLESKRIRLHALAGTSIENTLFRYNQCNTSEKKCNNFNAGIGVGLDIEILKRVVLNAHMTYQYSKTFGSLSKTYLGTGGGIGLSFHVSLN